VIAADLASWRRGDVALEVRGAGHDVVLIRLVGPGVSIAPVEHPMTLRGVRDVATIIAAALDTPSELDS